MTKASPQASPMDRREGRIFALFLLLFFASGFSALLYQVIWQRLLALFGGADVYSVTIIVSAYMAGLGCGSLAGGVLADRVGLRGRLHAFVFSELAIAAFAFVSVPLYYDLLYVRLGALVDSRLALAGILFLTLLWPTFYMGMSLPLLSKALTSTSALASRRIAGLYGINTLGAAVGSVMTMAVLARSYGFGTTVRIGAAVNLCCALGALVLARRVRSGQSPAAVAAPAVVESGGRPALFSLPIWIALYALSGYVALSLEIVWFRVLGVLIKANAFTFAVLLAMFLSFVGIGTLLARPLAERSRRPAAVFLVLQAAIPFYAGLSLTVLIVGLGSAGILDAVWGHVGGYEGIPMDAALRKLWRTIATAGQSSPMAQSLASQVVWIWGIVPLALMAPPTLLMGMSFTFLQRAIQTDLAFIGRRLGWLQTANIAGSLFGACFTGLFLLRFIGSSGTLRLLVVLGGLYLLLACRPLAGRSGLGRAAALAACACATALVAWKIPDSSILWAKLHGTT
ncbi:MAG: fused MFS/spermidine synthase, partial [Candidatus Binatia bacterium]